MLNNALIRTELKSDKDASSPKWLLPTYHFYCLEKVDNLYDSVKNEFVICVHRHAEIFSSILCYKVIFFFMMQLVSFI